jgi:hypothetical protein
MAEKLFIDDFVRGQGFDSTEKYIMSCVNANRAPQFYDVRYYKSLFGHGIIEEGFSIRTSDAGIIDEHYWVGADGSLIGEPTGPYPGKEGTFKPEEILSGKRISSGWTIESVGRLGYILRRISLNSAF